MSTSVAFVDLDDVIGHQSVRFPMHGSSRLGIRSFNQAVDGTFGLVEPVLLVVHPVLLLGGQVRLMSALDRFLGEVRHVPVSIHVERHRSSFF